MKIKTLIIAAALFAFTPALASAQSYEYMGREGKAMAAGEMFWKWLKGDDKKDEKPVVKSPSAKKKTSSAGKAKASQSAPYYLMGREGKMMALGEALQKKKNEADARYSSGRVVRSSSASLKQFEREEQAERSRAYAAAQKSRADYRKFVEAEVAKIPADQKAEYDALVNSKNWRAVEDKIKWFARSGNPKFNYDADRYYILQAAVKVNGKGLASFGSLRVAMAIMNTTDKFKSWAYKEAEKVQKSISNSGKAL